LPTRNQSAAPLYRVTRTPLDESGSIVLEIQSETGGLSVINWTGDVIAKSSEKSVAGLRALSLEVPDLFVIEHRAHTVIEASGLAEQALSLLLTPSERKSPNLEAEFDLEGMGLVDLYQSLSDWGVPEGWLVEVNSSPWSSWDDKHFLPATIFWDLIEDSTWIGMNFVEMASRTSGRDYEGIGYLNEIVGISWVKRDESEFEFNLFEIVKPVEHILEWVHFVTLNSGFPEKGNGSIMNAVAYVIDNDLGQVTLPQLVVFEVNDESNPGKWALVECDSDFDFEPVDEFPAWNGDHVITPDDTFEVSIGVARGQGAFDFVEELRDAISPAFPDAPATCKVRQVASPIEGPESLSPDFVPKPAHPLADPQIEFTQLKARIAELVDTGNLPSASEALGLINAGIVGDGKLATRVFALETLAKVRDLEGRADDASSLRAKAKNLIEEK